jgi:uncharacterized damage-inducible protein DinB
VTVNTGLIRLIRFVRLIDMEQVVQWRVQFDAEITFGNSGGLQTQGFRLDIPGQDISDEDLADYLVRHLGLLVVDTVRISNKTLFQEPHKGSRGGPTTSRAQEGRGDLRAPGTDADERTTLLAFLRYLREAVVAKLDGLPDRDVRSPGVPSGTSLLGLVKHLTGVELNWFAWSYAGEGGENPWDDDLTMTESDTTASVLAAYREAAGRSDRIIDNAPDLDRPGVRSLRETPPPSLRWILVHLIEETGRHAGHADILREQLDGATGR